MQIMRLPRFHSEVDTVVKHNITAISKHKQSTLIVIFLRSRLCNGDGERVVDPLEAGQSASKAVRFFVCNIHRYLTV